MRSGRIWVDPDGDKRWYGEGVADERPSTVSPTPGAEWAGDRCETGQSCDVRRIEDAVFQRQCCACSDRSPGMLRRISRLFARAGSAAIRTEIAVSMAARLAPIPGSIPASRPAFCRRRIARRMPFARVFAAVLYLTSAQRSVHLERSGSRVGPAAASAQAPLLSASAWQQRRD